MANHRLKAWTDDITYIVDVVVVALRKFREVKMRELRPVLLDKHICAYDSAMGSTAPVSSSVV